MVLHNDMQFAFASALLDQLEDYGANVREHHRRPRDRHHTAKTLMVANPSLEIQDMQVLAFDPTPYKIENLTILIALNCLNHFI